MSEPTVNKHTGGEWSVAPNGHCVFTEEGIGAGRGVAMCGMGARSLEEVEANAKLISAAPNMLTALRVFVELSKEQEWSPRMMTAFHTAKLAIKKAEGGR